MTRSIAGTRSINGVAFTTLALGALVTVGAVGVMVGIKFKTYQLLFELGEREAMIAAIKQVLGLQRTHAEKQQDLWIVLSAFSAPPASGFSPDRGGPFRPGWLPIFWAGKGGMLEA